MVMVMVTITTAILTIARACIRRRPPLARAGVAGPLQRADKVQHRAALGLRGSSRPLFRVNILLINKQQIYIYIYTYTYNYRLSLSMYLCIYVSIYLSLSLYIYIYIYIFTWPPPAPAGPAARPSSPARAPLQRRRPPYTTYYLLITTTTTTTATTNNSNTYNTNTSASPSSSLRGGEGTVD